MMDRATRQEFLKTIESQKEQIQRYEKKLRDVIQAYKGILKEKEALEASLKILSAGKERSKDVPTVDSKVDNENGTEAENKEGDLTADKESTELRPANEENDSSLENQLKVLSASLCTLTDEKSKLESKYINEKKQLRQEVEQLTNALTDEKDSSSAKISGLESNLQEMKQRLRNQQSDLEKEQNEHALLMRELHKLVAEERNSKEQLEVKLEDTLAALQEKQKLLPNMSEHYEKKLKELKQKLETSQKRVATLEQKAKEPSSAYLDLQKESAELKAHYRLQIQQEQKKVAEVENINKQLSGQSESRVAALEEKISELSNIIGEYERIKNQDQQTVQKLKEKIFQLDMENSVLAQAANARVDDSGANTCSFHIDSSDPQAIANMITQLQSQLKVANQKATVPVESKELLDNDENENGKRYKEELEALKEEFERYKLRAQSVLKNKSSKDLGTIKESDALKLQVTELREKIKNLRIQHQEEIDKTNQRSENLQKSISLVKENHKQELAAVIAEQKHRMSELEQEVKKQRERTVSMLAEKDREIDILRAGNVQALEGGYFARLHNPPDSGASAELPSDVMQSKSEEERAVSRLLNMSHGDANLLYFSQEQARKDVEINSLRKQKHELEMALRDMQINHVTKEENLHEKIDKLQEVIHKHQRDKGREGANLEYLKNVTYKFLVSMDPHAKQQMLNAIATILQFSPQERAMVHTQTKSWWK